MSDVFRSLCADLVRIVDAMDGSNPSIANQGQPLDGFSALANFRALAYAARKELARHEQASSTTADIATAVESEQLNPWKAELIDALVCSHILQEEHYSNPRKALNDLIAWDIQVATDPRTGPNALQKPKSFAEEPPTADDADDDGFIWGFDSHLNWKQTHWRLIGRFGYEYWLPLWALPLPTAD
jgi:hypothetical protein